MLGSTYDSGPPSCQTLATVFPKELGALAPYEQAGGCWWHQGVERSKAHCLERHVGRGIRSDEKGMVWLIATCSVLTDGPRPRPLGYGEAGQRRAS